MAAEYGLTDTTQTTMASFFDYDNDGDLDMYLGVNEHHKGRILSIFQNRNYKWRNRQVPANLYRNDWNAVLNHPVFTDVSKQAGIIIEGYGHAAILQILITMAGKIFM